MTDPVMRIIVVPATKQSRTYEMSYRRLRLLRGLGVVVGTVVAFMIATYAYMVSRHSQPSIRLLLWSVMNQLRQVWRSVRHQMRSSRRNPPPLPAPGPP